VDDVNRIKPILMKETKAGDLVITMGGRWYNKTFIPAKL
jgi:molybdopterin-biosynthesis enzyme MoeA-like protein